MIWDILKSLNVDMRFSDHDAMAQEIFTCDSVT